MANQRLRGNLTEAIEAVVSEKVNEGNKTYETLLHKDIEILRQEMHLSNEMLRVEMKEQKSEMVRWLFGFWITLVLLILANWFLKK